MIPLKTTTVCLLLAAAPALALPILSDVVYETTVPGYLLSGHALAVAPDGGAVAGGRFLGDHNENNVFVARFGPGGDLLWSTTVEGEGHDVLGDLVLDAAGDVYLAGWTDSDDFPLAGFATPLTGFRDAFLMKLDGADGGVVFSRLFGGEYTDEAHGICLDANGDLVVVGSTISRDFPVLDPVQPELNSYPYQSSDMFLVRFSADGADLLAGTFLGGSTDDDAVDVAVDAQGRIVILGYTRSTDFPVQAAYQSAYAGGDADLVVARFADGGATLEFATYLGGSDWDRAGGVAVGPDGAIHVGGSTRSTDLPTTAGALQPDYQGVVGGCEVPFGQDHNCEDGYVLKLAPDGGSLVYGTYLGGLIVDEVRDVDVDDQGRVRAVGYTFSTDFPGADATSGIFAVELTPDGSGLSATRLTTSASLNQGHAVAVGPDGDTYLTGGLNAPSDLYLARLSTTRGATAADDLPAAFTALFEAAPNPFNPRVRIAWELTAPGHARLEVFDARGRAIATLFDGPAPAGPASTTWRGVDDAGRAVAGGTYLLRLSTSRGQAILKLALAR